MAISVAVVAVRALSVGRGISRYAERLTSHDVAFRVLADIRMAVYRRLERLAPAGLGAFRSGDLLTRLVSDVDATQDLLLRGIGPPLVAALAGGGAVLACVVTLAPARAVLAAGLLVAAAGLGGGLMTAVSGLTLCGVLVLGVAAVSGGTLSRVSLAALTLTALASFEAVTTLPGAVLQLGGARASARRIGAILDAPAPVTDPVRPRPLPAGPVHVRMRGVQVRYQPAGPLALDGLDLDLAPGRRVALVGPTGAGKSTAAAVLLRFCDPCGGSVTLGGAELASYRADEVRTVIGGCPQDTHIFNGTIRDNLLLARPGATEDELAGAAARARLLPWIRRPGRRSPPICSPSPRAAPPCLSLTNWTGSTCSTRSSCWTTAGPLSAAPIRSSSAPTAHTATWGPPGSAAEPGSARRHHPRGRKPDRPTANMTCGHLAGVTRHEPAGATMNR